jgi:hypothetical protein
VDVALRVRTDNAFRQRAAIVFDQPVFPLEEIGDGLRLNADFDAAQAGEQQVHLPHESGLAALADTRRFGDEGDFAAAGLKQSPAFRQFGFVEQSARREIEALTAHALLRIFAEGLLAVGKKVGAGDLALDDDRAAFALPADDVRSLTAGAGLFRENDAATISAAEPVFGEANELGVGHEIVFIARGGGVVVTNAFRDDS